MAQDIVESVLLAKLDDFNPLQCEEPRHLTDLDHHFGAAEFLMITPCSHVDGYRCTNWIKYVLSYGRLYCPHCGLNYESSELILLPIGGQK